MDKKDFSFSLNTDDAKNQLEELGAVTGCLAVIVVIATPIALSMLLSPIVGVSVWKLVLILILARLWFI